MREKKEINVQVGRQIKIVREDFKLTQEQLAEYIDVTPQYVSDLERGIVGISLTTLKKICVVLHVSSDQILFGNQRENDVSAIMEACKTIPEKQFIILSEIIMKYIEAIGAEPHNENG